MGFLSVRCVERKCRRVASQRGCPLALLLPATGIGHALMVGSVLLVLIVELINSAVEAMVDRISLDNHRLAKRAKDIGSAAVLVSLINVAIIWLLVLLG